MAKYDLYELCWYNTKSNGKQSFLYDATTSKDDQHLNEHHVAQIFLGNVPKGKEEKVWDIKKNAWKC